MKPITEPSTLLANISHREMLDAMADNGIFCSVDKFRRVLDWAQKRALLPIAIATSDEALDRYLKKQENAE